MRNFLHPGLHQETCWPPPPQALAHQWTPGLTAEVSLGSSSTSQQERAPQRPGNPACHVPWRPPAVTPPHRAVHEPGAVLPAPGCYPCFQKTTFSHPRAPSWLWASDFMSPTSKPRQGTSHTATGTLTAWDPNFADFLRPDVAIPSHSENSSLN